MNVFSGVHQFRKIQPVQPVASNTPTAPTTEPSIAKKVKKGRCGWSYNQTLALIEFHSSHKSQFKSTTVKNDMVWNEFERAQAGPDVHERTQIKDKWAALKVAFYKSLDNRSNQSSGAGRLPPFDYFDEMYAIFKDDPRAEPAAIASSKRGAKNKPRKLQLYVQASSDDELENDSASEKVGATVHALPKLKQTKFERQLQLQEVDRKTREAGIERRHGDIMEMQKGCLSTLKDMTIVFKQLVEFNSKRKRDTDDSE